MSELKLPRLSMTMEDAAVTAWLVEDGAPVAAGDEVVEVETDKAQVVLEAPADGLLHHRAGVGDIVAIEGIIAVIGEAPTAELEPASSERFAPATVKPKVDVESAASPARGFDAARASPVARRAIVQFGLDPSTIVGTGIRGMITLQDVHRARDQASQRIQEEPDTRGDVSDAGRERRSAVVANLVASWERIPHIHVSGELSADGLITALERARLEASVTVTDLLLIALARALGEVPELNGTVSDIGEPQLAQAIDINLAVATHSGVVAPIVRNVPGLTLQDVAHERRRLVDASRQNHLDPRDLACGTCTLSNLGPAPVDFFAPIVTGPQIAVVATGRVLPKPVVERHEIIIGHRVTVNVALDHRASDGAAGGRLLAAFERALMALPEDLPMQKGTST
jgi:pyruvate dehydrogenase E2 component (dihydrolipoamide acetyltransferase)